MLAQPAKKSRPVRLANEPATTSGESGALLYSPMDEEWDHFFASSFFMASLDIAPSFFMASWDIASSFFMAS
jgi:hypothetical protein